MVVALAALPWQPRQGKDPGRAKARINRADFASRYVWHNTSEFVALVPLGPTLPASLMNNYDWLERLQNSNSLTQRMRRLKYPRLSINNCPIQWGAASDSGGVRVRDAPSNPRPVGGLPACLHTCMHLAR